MHNQIRGGVPDGDVLIHAGDFCGGANRRSVAEFLEWFAAQPHKHKVFIAGNHDVSFEEEETWCRQTLQKFPNLTYLQDSACEIEGIKFWGAPWQPAFGNWSFNLPRGPELADKWSAIPTGTDVLITHGPPQGILDECPAWPPKPGVVKMVNVGCADLLQVVERIKPKVHVFGHIHEGYGVLEENGTTFVNAACVNGRYQPLNRAIEVDI